MIIERLIAFASILVILFLGIWLSNGYDEEEQTFFISKSVVFEKRIENATILHSINYNHAAIIFPKVQSEFQSVNSSASKRKRVNRIATKSTEASTFNAHYEKTNRKGLVKTEQDNLQFNGISFQKKKTNEESLHKISSVGNSDLALMTRNSEVDIKIGNGLFENEPSISTTSIYESDFGPQKGGDPGDGPIDPPIPVGNGLYYFLLLALGYLFIKFY